MLPVFPNAKKRMDEMWREAMSSGMRSDPLLSGIAVRVQKEGSRAFVDGSETDYIRTSVNHEIKTQVARGLSVSEFYDAAEAVGRKLAQEQAKLLFEKMSEPSSVTQRIDLGPQATFDDVLAMWDRLTVRFVNGRPEWPNIVSSPEGVVRLRQIIENALHDTISRQKWQALFDRKLKEHNEREARRRLVD